MPLERPNQHLDRVQAILEGNDTGAQGSIAASWKRSAIDFGVDPASNESPKILTTGELKDHREKAKGIIFTAREELDQLFRIACPAGYVVLMSNKDGVVVDHRLEEAPSSRFTNWGNLIGGVWSEAAEGTNGTGTCVIERRPVTIHQSQHFRSRHIGSSCSAAPIFGVDDELVGVLDISSTDPRLSEHAHNLAGTLVTESARAIEERRFRERFRRHWIVAIAFPQAPVRTALIAVDKDRRIVGLDHNARVSFAQTTAPLDAGTAFWSLFERDDGIFRAKDGDGDFSARLTLIGGAETLSALITPPESPAALWRSAESAWLHCRPRRGNLPNIPDTVAPTQWKGGLPPRVLRRVEEYIDSHLSEDLELEQLAMTAGLSLHHFARAFKTSVGIPPHQFVLQRRLNLARDLLISTDRPIADIAIAAGFSDQSHLARYFRQSFAVSPIAFRRSHR
jgi:AraC-like DNA-binding protein